jgi:ABC-type Mn2+/Zn2+ transport system permease subunit
VSSDRKTAVALGILLLSSILFGILNTVLALESPDYLAKLSAIKTQVLIAVFFQAAFAIAYVGIAVLPYPILKRPR